VSKKESADPIQYLLDLQQRILESDGETVVMMEKANGTPVLDSNGKHKAYTFQEALRNMYKSSREFRLSPTDKKEWKSIFPKVVGCQEKTVKLFAGDREFFMLWLGVDKCVVKQPIGNGQFENLDFFDLNVQEQLYRMVDEAPKVEQTKPEEAKADK
jgi:hypothetical protein